MDDLEPIPISALAQYAYCPRRCALILLEGQWEDNEYTLQRRYPRRVVARGGVGGAILARMVGTFGALGKGRRGGIRGRSALPGGA